MKLTVSTTNVTSEDVPQDLSAVIRALAQRDESYFILEDSEGTFLQGTWSISHGYSLEFYQADVPGYHNSREPLPLETVAELVNRYRSSDASWIELCHWNHIPLLEDDDDSGDVCLGHFEGLAVRHLIKDLERNEVPCRVERQKDGFKVFVPSEFGDDAHAILRSLFPL